MTIANAGPGIGPRRLPAYRRNLYARLPIDVFNSTPDNSNVSDTVRALTFLTSDASLYYGTSDFCHLVSKAYGAAITSADPGSRGLTSPLSDKGFLYMAEPDAGGRLISLIWMITPKNAAFWHVAQTLDSTTLKIQAAYLTWQDGAYVFDDGGNVNLFYLMVTAWDILAQPNLVEKAERHPEPHEVKRARKKRHAVPESVTVVDLRRAARDQQAQVTVAEESRYHSRWIVSGHWREQPCGPGRAQRRRIYIAPHYKGPTDAPLVIREKVFQW